MKKKSFPYCLSIALIFMGVGILSTTGCNKAYTPPEVVGTWNLGANLNGNRHEAAIDFSDDVYIRLNSLGALPAGLKEKIDEAALATRDALLDLKTIKLNPDGTFNFTYLSTFPAAGTYTQEDIYIHFTCTTGHYPEVEGMLIGATDGFTLEMYPSSLTLMPFFLPFFSEDEIELIFGTSHPSTGLKGAIFFTRIN